MPLDAFNRTNKEGYANSPEKLLSMYPVEHESHLAWLSVFTSTLTGVPIELLKEYGHHYRDHSPKTKKQKRARLDALRKAKSRCVNKDNFK